MQKGFFGILIFNQLVRFLFFMYPEGCSDRVKDDRDTNGKACIEMSKALHIK